MTPAIKIKVDRSRLEALIYIMQKIHSYKKYAENMNDIILTNEAAKYALVLFQKAQGNCKSLTLPPIITVAIWTHTDNLSHELGGYEINVLHQLIMQMQTTFVNYNLMEDKISLALQIERKYAEIIIEKNPDFTIKDL